MAKKSLKHKAVSGVLWTAMQRYSIMLIHFISGIILARLLMPSDYGCIGMLAIFISLSETIINGGFGSALIQRKNPTQTDYSTIFWWNILMAGVLYSVLYVSAPAIARYYNIELLSDVLRVQGLVLFTYSLNMIQHNQLRKQLKFKMLSIIHIITAVISFAITVFMAYQGYGVWALVAQYLANSAIPMIFYWTYVRWRPKFVFSWKSFRELFGFGFYMFLTDLLNSFSTQIQGLLIGKKYDSAKLGYYSKANAVEKVASHSISAVMGQVTYPLYAEVQNDKARMANMIKRLTQAIAYITFPAMFILLLLAKPLFIFLYSDRWVNSVPYFQVLCIAGLGACLISVNTQPIAAIGKSKVMFVWTVVKRAIGVSAIVLGLHLWGMKGLLGGVIFNMWFSYFVNISLVSKYIGYKWKEQVLDLLPIGIAAALTAAVCYGVGLLCGLSMYPDAIVKFVIYVAIYMAWSLLFKPESFKEFISVIPQKFRLWENLGIKL